MIATHISCYVPVLGCNIPLAHAQSFKILCSITEIGKFIFPPIQLSEAPWWMQFIFIDHKRSIYAVAASRITNESNTRLRAEMNSTMYAHIWAYDDAENHRVKRMLKSYQ